MGIRTGWFLSNWYGVHALLYELVLYTHTVALVWYTRVTLVYYTNTSTQTQLLFNWDMTTLS
jgi:hypothetical protein